jgi:hypothetical protein
MALGARNFDRRQRGTRLKHSDLQNNGNPVIFLKLHSLLPHVVVSFSNGSIRLIKTAVVISAALLSVGCASVVNDSTQPMKIETKRADGTMVIGADCKISNDYGSTTTKSGDTTQVRRSSKDMDITCRDKANPEAVGRAISRANAGMAGNIIFGGGIGAIIDHNKGTAYTYPTWIQLIFGKTLVFDRSAEKDGQPVLGMEPSAQK